MLFKLVFVLVFSIRVGVVRGQEDAVTQVMSALDESLKTQTGKIKAGSFNLLKSGLTVMLSGMSQVERGEWKKTEDESKDFRFSLCVRLPKLHVEYRGKNYPAGEAEIKLFVEFRKGEQDKCYMKTYFPTQIRKLPHFYLHPLDVIRKDVNWSDVTVTHGEFKDFNEKVTRRVTDKISEILKNSIYRKTYTGLFGCP